MMGIVKAVTEYGMLIEGLPRGMVTCNHQHEPTGRTLAAPGK